MTLPEGAKAPVYESILTYKNKKTGEVKAFTTAEYTASKIWEDKNWEWQSTENELIATKLVVSVHPQEQQLVLTLLPVFFYLWVW